jgi:pimeloyl-ACP methyl ester carboxylesterase
MLQGWVALACLAGVAACQPDPDALQPATVQLHACRVRGVDTEVRCGDIAVPENRGPAVPGAASTPSITIHFTVVPAAARVRRPDPIFVLAGGPGQAASSLTGILVPLFARLNRERDLVFVDQRGTGASHPLACDEPDARQSMARQLDVAAALDALRACAARLRAGGTDTSQYLTVDAVQDLDEVRARLGYARVNLWGGSYGTRVALDYLRQFPHRVRSAVLDGVAPADMRLPISFAFDSDAALDRLMADCAVDLTCAAAYPGLKTRVDDLFTALRAHDRTVRVTHPLTGQSESIGVSFGAFTAWVRAPLYSPVTASLVPTAIAEAAQGNFDVLASFNLGLSGDQGGAISMGMHLSVVCGEDMSIITKEELATVAPTRFGRSFYDEYQRLCALWPSRPAPASFFAQPRSDVPILMLAGGLDPATPPRHAQRVAAHLTHAQLLIAPELGHGVSTQGCAPDLIEKFVRHPDAGELDGTCLRSIPRPPFFEPIARGDQ